MDEPLKGPPNGPVRLNSNPSNTYTILTSNKFISHIFWPKKLMTISIEADCTHPDLLILENIKLLLVLLCIQKGGMSCHSSAVFKNDCAVAFVGNSGSGKSTIADLLSKTWNMIDDDFNIFLPENGAFYIHTTPFYLLKTIRGNRPKSRPIQLKYIFILKKSIVTKIAPISSQEKYILIMGNTFAFSISEYFGQIMMENCQRLCECVPVSKLFFSKSDDINLKIDLHLKENTGR
jgi:hypothetical protein